MLERRVSGWNKTSCFSNSRRARWIGKVRNAIAAVKEAVEQDKKVFFHCSGERNRTGAVATGLLLELGHTSNVEDAAHQVKMICSIIVIKPDVMKSISIISVTRIFLKYPCFCKKVKYYIHKKIQ